LPTAPTASACATSACKHVSVLVRVCTAAGPYPPGYMKWHLLEQRAGKAASSFLLQVECRYTSSVQVHLPQALKCRSLYLAAAANRLASLVCAWSLCVIEAPVFLGFMPWCWSSVNHEYCLPTFPCLVHAEFMCALFPHAMCVCRQLGSRSRPPYGAPWFCSLSLLPGATLESPSFCCPPVCLPRSFFLLPTLLFAAHLCVSPGPSFCCPPVCLPTFLLPTCVSPQVHAGGLQAGRRLSLPHSVRHVRWDSGRHSSWWVHCITLGSNTNIRALGALYDCVVKTLCVCCERVSVYMCVWEGGGYVRYLHTGFK